MDFESFVRREHRLSAHSLLSMHMRLTGLATTFPESDLVLAFHPDQNRGEYHSLTRIHVQYAEFATNLCHK
jgi:hypothetical protein